MAATPLAGGQLYLDQAAAMARRGEQERAWLEPLSAELIAPVLSAKAKKKSAAAGSAGGGFGKAAPKQTQSAADVLAPLLAGVLQKEGVVRVDGALSPATAKAALEYVLAERSASLARVADGSARAQDCFGVELERGGGLRHDLLLPLAPLAQPLAELLGTGGSLGGLMKEACGADALLYELCALVTEPGSPRQNIHPDTPFQANAPLLCAFIALQDVTLAMGPTTFISRSHKEEQSKIFAAPGGGRDALLAAAASSFATLKAGDAVVFDSRLLHAGTANLLEGGATRAILNVSFRNVKADKPIGYKGSLRPGYEPQALEASGRPPLTLSAFLGGDNGSNAAENGSKGAAVDLAPFGDGSRS